MKKQKRPKKEVRWRRRLAVWVSLSKNENFMVAVREMSPMKHHAQSIISACEAFGLDPCDRRDLDISLGMLAHVIFATGPENALNPEFVFPGKAGKPVQWTEEKKRKFKLDRIKAMNIKPPTRSADTIAKRLQKPPFDLDYSKFKRSTLINHLRAIARIEKQTVIRRPTY
jgi:hypothetical protein